jgi:hypothetical protein
MQIETTNRDIAPCSRAPGRAPPCIVTVHHCIGARLGGHYVCPVLVSATRTPRACASARGAAQATRSARALRRKSPSVAHTRRGQSAVPTTYSLRYPSRRRLLPIHPLTAYKSTRTPPGTCTQAPSPRHCRRCRRRARLPARSWRH